MLAGMDYSGKKGGEKGRDYIHLKTECNNKGLDHYLIFWQDFSKCLLFYQVLYKNISEVIWERKLTALVTVLQSTKDCDQEEHGGSEDQHLPLQESERESLGVTSCADKSYLRRPSVIFRKACIKD